MSQGEQFHVEPEVIVVINEMIKAGRVEDAKELFGHYYAARQRLPESELHREFFQIWFSVEEPKSYIAKQLFKRYRVKFIKWNRLLPPYRGKMLLFVRAVSYILIYLAVLAAIWVWQWFAKHPLFYY